MVVQSPRSPLVDPRPTEAPDAGVIEEARGRQRRHRRVATVIAAAAVVVAAVAYGASGSGGGHSTSAASGADQPGAASSRHVVIEVNLSNGDKYDSISRVGGRLVVAGSTVGRHGTTVCDAAVVDPTTLVLSGVRSGSCDDPRLAGEPVLPIEAGEPRVAFPGGGTGIGTDTLRIAHLISTPPGYQVGPVVMRTPQISDEHPGWTYGDGYLWLYDGTSSHGSEVLRISESSGAVLARVSMPNLPRPILAADADGLWMAPSVNGGGRVVYHLALGATTATPILNLSRQYVAWMVAAGHDLWLDVASGGNAQTLLRLHGPSATPKLRVTLRTSTLDNEVQTQGGGATVVGDATDGLWTAVPPLQGNTQRIVKINPATGALARIATLAPAYAAPNTVAYGSYEAVAYDGSMFLLDPPALSGNTYPYRPTGFSALYRITPPK
jgi:hypothetical protein